MNNKVYVVHMLRWGSQENHSYILGVFKKQKDAQVAGYLEQQWRANKYEPSVVEVELDYCAFSECYECGAINKQGYDESNCNCSRKSGAW